MTPQLTVLADDLVEPVAAGWQLITATQTSSPRLAALQEAQREDAKASREAEKANRHEDKAEGNKRPGRLLDVQTPVRRSVDGHAGHLAVPQLDGDRLSCCHLSLHVCLNGTCAGAARE